MYGVCPFRKKPTAAIAVFKSGKLLFKQFAVSLLPIVFVFQQVHAAAEASFATRHRNKAGFYLRLPEAEREGSPEYFLRHPLVDAAMVGFKWSQIEPRDGQFDFTGIDRILALGKKHHKGIVIGFFTYDQNPRTPATPGWLYEKGVKKIGFSGGGVSRGREISVPKTWDEAYLRQYEKFILKISQRYDGEPTIWYIVPGFGHIGNINAQPSRGGMSAFLKEGWSPSVWQDFCLRVVRLYQAAFAHTPLLAKSAPMLLRDRTHEYYRKEADEILAQMARQRVSLISLGLDPDIDSLRENNVLGRLSQLGPYTSSGEIRLGIGDDWPLWLPEQRRRNQKNLAGRDEEGLARELQYAFGGTAGLPKSNISIMHVLHPEIDVSHPDKGIQRNSEVYRLLEAARKRLKEEDPIAKVLGPNEASKGR